MRAIATIFAAVLIMGLAAGCSQGHKRYHDRPLPDPKAYNAHFPDMDRNGDDMVDWPEFEKHFPDTDRKVFDAVDMNDDATLDHDEWHAFKKAHGLGHKE